MIGVVVAKLNAISVARITQDIPQNVNFAIKASSVTNFLDSNSIRYLSDSLTGDLSMETLAQRMKEFSLKIRCN